MRVHQLREYHWFRVRVHQGAFTDEELGYGGIFVYYCHFQRYF